MKKSFLLIWSFVTCISSFSQAPNEFNYQAVARNAAGALIANQNISVRFRIHTDLPTGTIVYSETRTVTTNQFGLFTVGIGSPGANDVTGSVAGINWNDGPKYLQVEIDLSGGSTFTDMGTSKLLSVPYAVHAATSASDKWSSWGNDIYKNNSGNVGIGLVNPISPLSFGQNLGPKISLWNEGSSVNYGIGIQDRLLQIHTDISDADVAFGYGSSNTFTETMRIKGNGNLGIGMTDPAFRLDVRGRIRIRTGLDGTPGIWLNNSDNTASNAFVGMENNDHVGFYGDLGAGWAFRINVLNGDAKLSGKLGISELNPQYPLSFPGSLGNKISLWTNSNYTSHYGLGIQGGLLQVFTAAAVDDIAFGYGNSNAFTETMRIKGNGVMQFPASLGKKIILFPGGIGDAGFGVHPNELRIASDYSGAATTFGYDNRTSGFTELMRISGNGNVGIGNSDPTFQLDVNNRIRIRSGGNNNSSAGIFLNNNANNLLAAFVGMEDDSHVGFYGGNGAGWKFAMNTQTGALRVNGSEGQTGEILQSNGTAAPSWRSNPVNDMYNLTEEIPSTSFANFTTHSETLDIPGMTKTFVLSKPSRVVVSFMVYTYNIGCSLCSGTEYQINLVVNNESKGGFYNTIGNDESVTVSGSRIFTLTPGTYTIKTVGLFISGQSFYAGTIPQNSSTRPSVMTLQVIPQN